VQVGETHHHFARTVPPLAVGDSTMLLSIPALTANGFDVNARGCRQFPETLALLSSLAGARQLPHLVVVAMGANGIVTNADVTAALRILGPNRVLGLLTPRQLGGGSDSNAATVRAAGRRYPERIDVLDWVAYSAGHAAWFQPDGLHLTLSGAAAFARLIASSRAFASPPPATITLATRPSTAGDIAFHTQSTWSVRSPGARARGGRPPGRCGYRLVLSAAQLSPSTGGNGATGVTAATGASGDTGATAGSASLALAAALTPSAATPGPSGTTPDGAMPDAGWVTWRQPGAALGGAWAAPTATANAFDVVSASGETATGCPRGTVRRAEVALTRVFSGARPTQAS
jgi:hypothetical protein